MEPPGPVQQSLLVVEDNAVAREGLADLLQRAGYHILLAANGEEALNYLQDRPKPDLILLDMIMPVLDGWHFLSRLQREGPTVPILVMTGTILTREWAKDHGCRGFVRKPIEAELLLDEIRRCLGEAEQTP